MRLKRGISPVRIGAIDKLLAVVEPVTIGVRARDTGIEQRLLGIVQLVIIGVVGLEEVEAMG